MIFKTFNSSVNKSIAQIGIFNKSFWAMQQDLKHGNGLAFSIFGGQSVTNKDIQAILDLNAQLKNDISPNQAWARTMTNCSIAAQEQARQCLKAKGNLAELANGLKTTTIASKAAELEMKALSIASNITLMWGISELIQLIHSCATASDRLLKSAKELGDEFFSKQSNVESYKSRIEELYKTIDDNSSSYKNTYNARQELLSIQNEMIEKFGSEAKAVELVTQAINGQTDALDILTEKEWIEAKNKFIYDSNKKWYERIGDKWSNFWSGSTDNFDRMKKDMEDTEITFFMTYGSEEFYNNLEKMFGVERNKSRFLPRDFDDAIGIDKGQSFTLSGNLNDIYDKLINIQNLAKNMGIDDQFLEDLSEQANKAKEKLDGYNDFYNQSVLYEKINNNEAYKESFLEIEKEYKRYQNMFASGDEEAIAKAKQSYAEVVQSTVDGINDQSVINYFNNMHPELQEAVGNWEFEVKFKAAIDDESDNFENDVKDAVDSFNSTEDILNFNAKTATQKQIYDYTELEIIADKYNLTLDQLTEKLKRLGLISSQLDVDLHNSIRQITDEHGISDREETSKLEVYTKDFTEDQKKIWLEATRGAKNAAEAIEMYLNYKKGGASPFDSFTNTSFGDRIQHITDLFNEGALSHKKYFDSLQSEIDNFDASGFTNSVEDMNKASEQFFVDSMQQIASGLSSLINSFNNGEMSISEYLDGYLAIGNTLSTLTDNLQENSAAWANNGKALSDLGNAKLDETQDSLNSAMSKIKSYQDSIYSLEQIMSDSVTVGSDEFSAHAAVIAEDLYNIIQTGGQMADTVANTLGTSTSEIAQSLTQNVSNQEIACQAIMANSNSAISEMSSSIGKLFNVLGTAISNFKVDISFGIKSLDWKSVNVFGRKLNFPEIQFELGASGESLDMIGSTLSAFGESIASSYDSQKLSIEDFYFGNTDAAKNRNYTPDSNVTENYEKKLDRIRSSSKSSMQAAEKDWKEHLDQCLALYQAELDAGLIDFETFLSKSNALIEEYYRDGKISAKEYYDYIGKMLETQKGIYDKVLSAVTKRFDREIDQIQDSIDAIEKQNEALEKQKDEYDTILSVVDSVYEKQIEHIQSQQDAIQDTIDALQEENDVRKFALQLEQAKWELYQAQTQRTRKIFNGTEFVYDTDKDAIRDAQENLADLTLEQTVDGLEKEKDALDAVIEELEYYRSIWSEISGAREKSENEQLAIALWGESYESIILSNRLSDIESFKDNYLSTQQQINDNQTLIDSYNEKIEYYEALKESWNSITDAYETSMNEQLAAQVLGADWESQILSGRLETLQQFRDEYIAIQQAIIDFAWQAANSVLAAQNAANTGGSTSGGGGATSSNSDVPKPTSPSGYATYKIVGDPNGYSSSGLATSQIVPLRGDGVVKRGSKWFVYKKIKTYSNAGTAQSQIVPDGGDGFIEAYSSGTANARKGTSLVGEKGAEAIIDKNKNVSLVTQPALIKMQGSETVKNAAATKDLLKNHSVISLGKNPPALKTQSDVLLEQWQKIVPDLSDLLLPARAALSTAHQFAETRSQAAPVVQNITLTLPNVTNNSGYERIKKELRQMQIDAYQNAHRRNP